MIIKMEHMRLATFCASGVETFFQRHQLDYQDFLNNGIDETLLLKTESPLARRVVALAQGEVL